MPDLLSFDGTGFQFAWDATSLSSFAKCPRYYYYKHLQGWQSNSQSVHLTFGGIYAAALEHYHKLLATGVTAEDATREVVLQALVSSWVYDRDETGQPIPGSGEPWQSLHNTKTRETLIRSIVWYLDHFAEDTTTTLHFADGRPAVELSFSMPFGDDDLLYCGHMDRVVEYGGDKFVMDQKTTGSTITEKYFSDFTPDIQMSGYSWAGAQMFNTPISGVIIDAAQIAVGFTRFERGFVHRPAALLEEWYDNSHRIINEARQAHTSGNYRMNPTACANYGGCEFRKVCSRHPDHRSNILAADFHRRDIWDPLKQR